MTATSKPLTARVTVAAVYITCPRCKEAIPDAASGSEMHDRVTDEVTCPRCNVTLRVPKSATLPRGW